MINKLNVHHLQTALTNTSLMFFGSKMNVERFFKNCLFAYFTKIHISFTKHTVVKSFSITFLMVFLEGHDCFQSGPEKKIIYLGSKCIFILLKARNIFRRSPAES